jgi:hypothetical protein
MQQLLESEGIVVVDHQIVDFEKTLLDSDVMEQVRSACSCELDL